MTAATLDLPERYTRPHLLGRGAVSAVYRAHDRLLGRDVALKILQWDDERLTARLMREARVQGQLDHPSICKIYDSGTHRGQAFIAMELIDGVELGALTLPLTELLRLVAEIADALHVAHAAGLVHRDIKPTHIVVERLADDRPRPVLIDFGLVHEMPSASDTLTEARDTIGTPAFMAPEQIRAGAAVDARADVYALGATLYALLAGHPPFDDDAGDDDGAEPPSSLEIMRRTLNSAPTPLRRLNPAVPARVAQLVHACLEKQPDDRPPSAAALAEDLRRLARGDLSVHRT
ncbi:MAG: serine/threonine-protein kinase, partial [Acidobacteriota bacterium]